MKISFLTVVVSLLLSGYVVFGEDSIHVEVRVDIDSFDGNEIWIGVFGEDVADSKNTVFWICQSTREFSIAIPAGNQSWTVVFLKKNYVPIVKLLTPDILESGFELDFSSGLSIFGRVTATSGEPISEGSVSLNRLHDIEFFPPDPELSSWKIADDGTFEILGLQPGLKYVVAAVAPGFMPAITETILSEDELRQEMIFELAKATYVTGRIVNRYGTSVRGEFNMVVTPMDSQTTEIHSEYDRDDNFRIGPFAEGVTVELTAHDGLDRRSKAVEVQTPAEGLELLILRWVPIMGTVQNRDTGEYVEEFQVISPGDFQGLQPLDVFAPDGRLELEIDELSRGISIVATDFLLWESGIYMKLEGRESYDLGIIELEPSHTLRGRVTDSTTQLPIENVWLRRMELQDGILSPWVFHNVKATTDAEGEFEMKGFPSVDGLLSVSARGYQDINVPVDDVESYLEIELDPKSGSISGRVVSVDGEPVYPASVSIGMSGKRNAEDGSFTFSEITGNYRISASSESGWSEALEVAVENGEHISGIELVISEIGRAHGTVRGLAAGETAKVTVSRRGGDTNASGTYEVRGIPIGEHVIQCTTSSGRRLSRMVTMDETLDARIDFVFEGTFSILGRVTAAGQPGPGLDVQAMPMDENHASAQAITDGDGTYVIEGLDEGDYTVSVTSRGVSRKVAVVGDTYVDFDLGSNELSGHIKASGSVLGVHVSLTGYGSDGRFQQRTTVDASGFYRFWGLASGSYEVTVMKRDRYKKTTRSVEIETSVHDFDIFIDPIGTRAKKSRNSK